MCTSTSMLLLTRDIMCVCQKTYVKHQDWITSRCTQHVLLIIIRVFWTQDAVILFVQIINLGLELFSWQLNLTRSSFQNFGFNSSDGRITADWGPLTGSKLFPHWSICTYRTGLTYLLIASFLCGHTHRWEKVRQQCCVQVVYYQSQSTKLGNFNEFSRQSPKPSTPTDCYTAKPFK